MITSNNFKVFRFQKDSAQNGIQFGVNVLEKFNYNLNLVWINKINKKSYPRAHVISSLSIQN